MKNLPQRTREQAQAMQRIKDATVDTAYDAVVAYFKICGIDSSAAGVHGFLDLLRVDGLRNRGYFRGYENIIDPLRKFMKTHSNLLGAPFLAVIEVCYLIQDNETIQEIVKKECDEHYGYELYWQRIGGKLVSLLHELDRASVYGPKFFEQKLYSKFVLGASDIQEVENLIKQHIEKQLQQLTAAPSSPKKEEPAVPPQTKSSDLPKPAEHKPNKESLQPSLAHGSDVQPSGEKSWGKGAMIGGAAGAAVASAGVAGISIGQANTSVYSLLVQSLHSNQIAANAIVVVGAGVLIAVSAAVGAGAQKSMGG